jgi:tetratricopeptide (TPR) repeat protein
VSESEAQPGSPVALVGALLVLAVLAIYYPVSNYAFINYDDPLYVSKNPVVLGELTFENVATDFTSATVGNWHPLTMLSLQWDRYLFGPGPRGFHLTNVFLHAGATLLLFLALQQMTGSLWKGAWVAAIFALHPLRVESVAWISERKDVLSGFFWMLTLLLYGWYARSPNLKRLACVALSLALGLAAKPMLVTMPFVLLLLDIWPLRRLAWPGAERGSISWRRAIIEKLPLFLLSGIFCVIAIFAQRAGEALRTFNELSLGLRLEHALVAPCVYLGKLFWPFGLVPFYPLHNEGFPAWQLAGAALLFLSVSVICWQQRHLRPYLAFGWCWYVGALVPVIGLVQVGNQAWADRYTYIPLIGILCALAWGVHDLCVAWRMRVRIEILLGAATVCACVLCVRTQLSYWQDDVSLWEHALSITPTHGMALNNLGVYMIEHGNVREATRLYSKALAADEGNVLAATNLASIKMNQKKPKEAIQILERALAKNPDNDGICLLLGRIHATEGQSADAVHYLQEAVRFNPKNNQAFHALGQALEANGQPEEAARAFAEAVHLAPRTAEHHCGLGFVLYRLGNFLYAAAELRKAITLNPNVAGYHSDLALVLFEMGEKERAKAEYRAASALEPDWIEKRYAFVAQALASKDTRAGVNSALLPAAKETCQATDFRNAQYVASLAAVYAQMGQFSEALRIAHEAFEVAKEARQETLAGEIQEQVRLYESKKAGVMR